MFVFPKIRLTRTAVAFVCVSTEPPETTARLVCGTTGTGGGSEPRLRMPTLAFVRSPNPPPVYYQFVSVAACECNNWSTECRFNEELYMKSRRGGECQNCGGNRAGPHCELCQENHYISPEKDAQGRQACLPCDCHPTGTSHSSLPPSPLSPLIFQAPPTCSVPSRGNVSVSPG